MHEMLGRGLPVFIFKLNCLDSSNPEHTTDGDLPRETNIAYTGMNRFRTHNLYSCGAVLEARNGRYLNLVLKIDNSS